MLLSRKPSSIAKGFPTFFDVEPEAALTWVCALNLLHLKRPPDYIRFASPLARERTSSLILRNARWGRPAFVIAAKTFLYDPKRSSPDSTCPERPGIPT